MSEQEHRYARAGAPAWCALVSFSLVCAANAFGQSDTDALTAVRACSSIQSDTERLACLDAALGANAAADAPAEAPAEAPVEAPVAASAPAPAAIPAPVPVQAQAPASAPASGPAPAQEDAATAGQRTAAESQEPDAERPIRIVEIRRTGLGVTTFVADDGTAWENRGGTQGRFPPEQFDAVLRPALGDSYFLISPLGGPRTRVQLRP